MKYDYCFECGDTLEDEHKEDGMCEECKENFTDEDSQEWYTEDETTAH